MPSEPKRKLQTVSKIINANKLVYGDTESGINQDH